MRKHLTLFLSLVAGTTLFLFLFLAWPWHWMPAQRSVTIGVLSHAAATESTLAGFKEGMAALGFREGETVRYFYDGPQADAERLEEEARRLAARHVDLVLTLSTPATQAAQRATEATILPIVFAPAANAVDEGIVQSLRHPGGNTTGVTFGRQEARRLEWLVRLAPTVRRIFIPYNATDAAPRVAVEKLREPARKLGVELVLCPIGNDAEMKAVLSNPPPEIDAIFLPPDALVASYLPIIIATAKRRHLPLSSPFLREVAQGVLVSLGIDRQAVGRQAARLAGQVLDGLPPADLPVETAEARLAVNLDTARAIGLAIPDDILRQAVVMHGQVQ